MTEKVPPHYNAKSLQKAIAEKRDSAQLEGKSKKLGVGGGLFILVNPNGSTYWRYKYRLSGKEKLYAIGVYPSVTLAQARELHRKAVEQVQQGNDPVAVRRIKKAEQYELSENTLGAIAKAWLQTKEDKISPSHYERTAGRIDNHIPTPIKNQPIKTITTKQIADFIYPIAKKGKAETAKRVLNIISQIYRYGMVFGYVDDDRTRGILEYLPPAQPTNYASIKDPHELGLLLQAIEGYQGHYPTKMALIVLAHTFVRPGELRGALWSEIDLNNALWEIPANKMKAKRPHSVPLSTQVVAMLREIQEYSGRYELVFPSPVSNRKPLSNNTLNQALRRLGYTTKDATAHGFRATASTLLREKLHQQGEWVEAQLAHTVKSKTEAAYNHAQYLDQRRDMMQQWSDYLDQLAEDD